jgi:hypothetical protein
MTNMPTDLSRELVELYRQRVATGESEQAAIAAMLELYGERVPGCGDFELRDAVARVAAECRLRMRSQGKLTAAE